MAQRELFAAEAAVPRGLLNTPDFRTSAEETQLLAQLRALARRATHALKLEPRSTHLMRGAARWECQHAISATKQLRYLITCRTRRV